MSAEPLRLLVADRRALHCAALGAAFAAEDDVAVVAQVPHAEALDRVQRLEPDLVCVGSAPQTRDGLLLSEQLKAERPAQRVLVVDDTPDPRMLLGLVRVGVEGYVTHAEPLTDLVDAARRIHAGEVVIPPRMLGRLLRDLTTRDRRADETYQRYLRLTARERQVLELLAEGCGNGAIAEILVISPQTSRTHIQNVVRKLGAHSRLEVAAMAAEHGWVRRTAGRP